MPLCWLTYDSWYEIRSYLQPFILFPIQNYSRLNGILPCATVLTHCWHKQAEISFLCVLVEAAVSCYNFLLVDKWPAAKITLCFSVHTTTHSFASDGDSWSPTTQSHRLCDQGGVEHRVWQSDGHGRVLKVRPSLCALD